MLYLRQWEIIRQRGIHILSSLLLSYILAMTLAASSVNLSSSMILSGYATAYCQCGVTASGEYTRDGICAGKDEWLGKTIILYQRLPNNKIGEQIGIYECLDTGGTPGLKEGKVIDVWCQDLDTCQEFMNLVYEDGCQGHVYIQVIDADG